MEGWSDAEWLTLQLGPIWIASALIGSSRFDGVEGEAFWRLVSEAPTDSPLSWQLAQARSRNQEWLLDEFFLEERSIVSGLHQVASLLERVPPETSRDVRACMLRVGWGLARARGPFGKRASEQDAAVLGLVAQLLETTEETVRANPLNAAGAV